jgi:transmembrane sensor
MADRIDIAAAYLARMLSRRDSPATQSEMDEWEEAAPENRKAMEDVFAAWDVAGSTQDSPEIQQMLAEMRERTQPRRESWLRSGTGKWAIAAGLVAMVSASAIVWFGKNGSTPGASEQAQIAAAPNDPQILTSGKDRRTIRLPDGSRITLDRNSSIKLAYSDNQRGVTLQNGRAHFAVHKDAGRPFIVSAGRLTATAVGTAFDVSLSPKGEGVMISEGTVRVVTQLPAEHGGHTTLLNAGMKLVQYAGSVELTPVDIMQESAWTDGKIIFSSHCLTDVARQMNPYAGDALLVGPDAARIAISGVFDLNNAEGLAHALEQQGLATVRHQNGKIILSRIPAAGSTDCRSMN